MTDDKLVLDAKERLCESIESFNNLMISRGYDMDISDVLNCDFLELADTISTTVIFKR